MTREELIEAIIEEIDRRSLELARFGNRFGNFENMKASHDEIDLRSLELARFGNFENMRASHKANLIYQPHWLPKKTKVSDKPLRKEGDRIKFYG